MGQLLKLRISDWMIQIFRVNHPRIMSCTQTQTHTLDTETTGTCNAHGNICIHSAAIRTLYILYRALWAQKDIIRSHRWSIIAAYAEDSKILIR